MGVCLLLGGWLRGSVLGRALDSDEMANVMPFSAWQILTDEEAGVNPPLLRLLFNVPFHESVAPYAGRWFSLLCSVAAIGLAYLVGRDAGGRSRGAGFAAALLFAVHPLAVSYASSFRIYAWWTATALLHVLAVGRALEGGADERRWERVAIGTAVLLPWIHYVSVPWLLLVGVGLSASSPGRRGWWLRYLPAAVGILPMVPAVLFQESRRVAPGELPEAVLVKVLGLGWSAPLALADVAAWVWAALGLTGFRWNAAVALLVVVAFAVHGLRWRSLTPTLRVVWWGGVGLAVSVYALAHVQWVRDPTILMMLVFAAPALGALPTLAQGAAARTLGWLVLGYVVLGQAPDALRWHLHRAGPTLAAEGVRRLASQWRLWDEARAGRALRVHPPHYLPTLYYYQTGEHFSRAPVEPACGLYGACYVRDGVVVAALSELGDGGRYDALVVSVEARPEAGFGSACVVLHDEPGLVVWDCAARSGVPAQ